MSSAVKGIGSTFSIAGSAVDEVLSISGPETTQELIDATSLDSSTYTETIGGFIDAGKVSIGFNWTNTSPQQAIRNAFLNRQAVSCAITFNGGGGYSFTAIVDSFAMSIEPNSAITGKASFRLRSISWGVGDVNVLVGGAASTLSVLVGGSAETVSFV